MFITTSLAEAISLRFKDVLEFHPSKEAFITALGRFTVGSLEELKDLHIHDFGIFLELEPDQEEKQMLEANIQVALSQGSIFLEDAIDIREINNTKLANQLLKFRRIKKQQVDQAQAQAASAAQAEAQGQAQIVVEQAKAQAEQVKTESKIQVSTAENELSIKKMEVEARTKRELMQYEFDLNVQLKQLELQAQKELVEKQSETQKEIANTKVSASKITGPPDTGKPQKSFESKGNDVLGGFDLSRFEPR